MIVEGKPFEFNNVAESPAARISDTIFDLTDAIYDLKDTIQTDLPKSREASLAITKLDEARLWLEEISVDSPE